MHKQPHTKEYVDDCRSQIATQVSDYRALVAAAKPHTTANAQLLKAALEAFEPHFFNSMVLALDSRFVHRARAEEGWQSAERGEDIVQFNHEQRLRDVRGQCADKTIKYDPAKSVLKCRLEDKITLKEADFTRLSAAFLAEIEAKYL